MHIDDTMLQFNCTMFLILVVGENSFVDNLGIGRGVRYPRWGRYPRVSSPLGGSYPGQKIYCHLQCLCHNLPQLKRKSEGLFGISAL